VAGASFGGFASQVFASKYGERVEYLVLLSTGNISWASKEYPFDNLEFAKRFAQEFVRDYERLPPTMKANELVNDYYSKGQPTRAFVACYDNEVTELHFLMMSNFNHDLAPKIKVPTFVLTGGGDELMPIKWVKKLSELIEGSVYSEVPGAGHACGCFFAKEVCEQIVGYLEQHVGKKYPKNKQ
jgi:pimeloyl-ACP methyl ester carboxylesterase